MNSAFDPIIQDVKKEFPVREGQGDNSSIRGDKNSGIEEPYPAPTEDDKQHKEQDEYDNIKKEKQNKTV